MTDFRLFETMRVSEDGKVYLLERHLERLRFSADYFSFKFDSAILRETLAKAISEQQTPARLRATFSMDGSCLLQFGPLPADRPRHLSISGLRVDSSDTFLYHKTSRRGIYEDARKECSADADVLLVNERGEVTETTIANVAVLRGGEWVTPHISCGLLPGVMRAELLANGEVVEGIVRADELVPGESIRCFNALRGVFDAVFEGD